MSVAELNAGIGAVLSRAFPDEVWVRGEIANLNRPPSGHVYFDLVGDGCALGVTLWASDKQVVNAVLRRAGGAVRMTDGTEVRIRVRVSWYAERGRVSLRMLSIDTAYTLGRLAEARELLLRTLQAEGLLRRQANLTLPPVPLRVGLVTSDGSAAAHDFLRTLEGKRSRVERHACSTPVCRARLQSDRSCKRSTPPAAPSRRSTRCASCGAAAREQISRSSTARRSRGRSRCAPVVVWTGIGHEIDTTVADAVAHRSFRTPTACAMALVGAGRQMVRPPEQHLERRRPCRVAPSAPTRGRRRRLRATARRRPRVVRSTAPAG